MADRYRTKSLQEPSAKVGHVWKAGFRGAVPWFKPSRTVLAMLALQLRVSFEVGFLCCGLMASAPDGPGDNESRFNATLDQTPGNTTDFLE